MRDTLIGWCHHSINFWLGCDRVSKECQGCYAEALMKRRGELFNVLRLTCGPWYDAEKLNAAAAARNTHELVFANSMSDLFHHQADNWREEAWDVIRRCRNLIWIIPTKRPERILDHLPKDWDSGKSFPHVWLGTTCGAKASYERVNILRSIPCALRFISCEPLLEDISDIDLRGIAWVLCGGMSGPLSSKVPIDIRWAVALYDATRRANVKFLFKQVSAYQTERGINALGMYIAERDGEIPPPNPAYVDCIREYPETELSFIRPQPKGKRFTAGEWDEYRKRMEAVRQPMKIGVPAAAGT